jgi:hypothetical protein
MYHMKVTTMMLADAARAVEQKLYVFGGGWDRIWTQAFPTTHPSLALALVFQVEYSEALIDHQVDVTLEKDGEVIIRGQIDFHTGHAPRSTRGAPTFVPYTITYNMLQFDEPGRYEWVAREGDTELGRLPLEVTKAPPIK